MEIKTSEIGDKKMKAVLETRNYDRFKQYAYNRNIRKIKPLTDSMKKYGFLSSKPITVIKNIDGSYTIIDGHHRCYVAKQLGIPIKFVVEEFMVDMLDMINAERVWRLSDFATSFNSKGLPDYLHLQSFCDATGITQSIAMMIMSGKSSKDNYIFESFKRGLFKITEPEFAWEIGDIVIFLKGIGIPYARDNNFVSAIAKCIRVSEFKPETFKEKSKSHKHFFDKQPDVGHYIDMIDRVYNYHNRNKIPLAFHAKEVKR